MLEFVLALIVVLVIITAMSVGVLMGRKPISGSCGGMGAALGDPDYECEICGGDPARCDESGAEDGNVTTRVDMAYDASRDGRA